MEDSNEIIEVEWTAEILDNGIVLEDEDALAKEAAVVGSDPDDKESIKRLLGKWFFAELDHAFESLSTPIVRIKIQIESKIWEFIPLQLASVVLATIASVMNAANNRPYITKAL